MRKRPCRKAGPFYFQAFFASPAPPESDLAGTVRWLRDRELIQKVGGTSYLAQLTEATPAVYNVQHHARTVKEKWRLRRVIAVCQQTAAEGYGDVGEPQQFIEGTRWPTERPPHTA